MLRTTTLTTYPDPMKLLRAHGNTGSITTNGDGLGVIMQAPATGDITAVEFLAGGTLTGSPFADISVETVAANGDPSGTLVNAGATVNFGIVGANTLQTATLGTPASVTKGQFIAITWKKTAGTSFNLRLKSNSPYVVSTPYGLSLAAGVWSRNATPIIMQLKYGSTYYPQLGVEGVGALITTNNLNTGSSPDELGNRFKLNFSTVLAGVVVSGVNAGDFDIVLYDENSNVLLSKSIDGDYSAATTTRTMMFLFDSEYRLKSGRVYRIVIKPTTATNFSLYENVFSTADRLKTFEPSGEMYSTERTDGGAWTDTTTNLCTISLVIKAVSDGNGNAFAA